MKMRNNRGSIAVFVLVGLFFMSSFLLITYANNINKSKVAKEQFDMISNTYTYHDGDANAYNRAYDALRSEKKQVLTGTVSNDNSLTIDKTFEDRIVNYRIYGSISGVGKYDSSTGKYIVKVTVKNSKGDSSTNEIYLTSQLNKTSSSIDYIDYKTQSVLTQNTTNKTLVLKEKIGLPVINAYEEETIISVDGGENNPSKIEVEYLGYSFE